MRFKADLDAKRQELVRDIHAQAAELAIGEGGHDPIDRVQSMNQRDDAVTILRRLSRTLADVDSSLRAMPEGRYGVCVECGQPIGLKRLVTIPWAFRCIGCQELLERRESMHAAVPPIATHGQTALTEAGLAVSPQPIARPQTTRPLAPPKPALTVETAPPVASAGSPSPECDVPEVNQILFHLMGRGRNCLAYHAATYLGSRHPNVNGRILPAWLIRAVALGPCVRFPGGELAQLLREDFARFDVGCFEEADGWWNQAVRFLAAAAALTSGGTSLRCSRWPFPKR